MSCPTPERLREGPFDPTLDEHVDGCDDCAHTLETLGASSPPEPPPSRIEEYELLARIGGGTGGEVWEAHDTALDRTVAIKLPAGASTALARARFRREAWAAARLQPTC
jgi:serine/threonine protein kinase